MATLLAVTALSAALSAAGPALRPFDPLALLQDKAAQTTALKSLGVPGREVATLALG